MLRVVRGRGISDDPDKTSKLRRFFPRPHVEAQSSSVD